MRPAILLLLALATLPAQTAAEEKSAIAVIQKLFDAMAAHDSAAIRGLLLPDARLQSVRDWAEPLTTTGENFATQIGNAKVPLVERFTGTPRALVQGRMAQVWGEYEFLRDGKFSHCGVDTATLFKTPDGWRIAALAYTVETTGCKSR